MTPEARVQNVLRTLVAPSMDLDASEIEVVEIVDGVVSVRLGEICSICPSVLTTIVSSLEQELKKHFPEIEILTAVR